MLNKKNKNFGKLILGIFLLSLLLLSFPLNSRAVEYGGVGGRPAYPREDNKRSESIFIHNVDLGEKIKDGVIVVNSTDQKKTIKVYAVDSVRSSGGALACAQKIEPKTSVGSWITLQKDEVTLEPFTQQTVDFEIAVPQTRVDVGEHNGCIVIEEKREASAEGGIALTVRSAIRVLMQIKGEVIKKLQIESIGVTKGPKGNYIISPVIKNSGNVSLDADINLKVKNSFNNIEKEYSGVYSILRGETTTINFEFDEPLLGGNYTFDLSVKYDGNTDNIVGENTNEQIIELNSVTTAFLAPSANVLGAFLIAIGIILLLVTSIVGYRFWKNKQIKDLTNSWIKYTVKKGDDIRLIAQSKEIPWKTLAKANRIKSPYFLEIGQVILVPPKTKN